MRTAAAIAALMLIAPAAGAQDAETRTETRVMVLNGPGGEGGLDRDGDGYVTRDEFLTPMMTAWERIDVEGAGRVSAEDLARGVGGGEDGERHVFMFRSGEDGPMEWHGEDGPVIIERSGGGDGETRVEVRRIVRGGPGGEYDGGHGPRIMMLGDSDGAMDTDGDGRVSEAEFLARMGDAFRRMDADGSGYLEDGEHGARRIVRRERVEE
ncbi:MAG: hypothetical protein ACI8U3_000195 [Brevundimonas sp.]|jgi:hypothetical protein|uniref:EF-hand domain-containing protein n=1 Tax=Brevundimonas sp. TaxID=1871086 RepID=UPI0039E2313C